MGFYPYVQRRLSREGFTGLPLTVLATVFVFSLGLLLAIIRLYLSQDPLANLDVNLAHLLYTIRGPRTLTFFYFLTLFGESMVAIGTGVCLSVFLWIKKQHLLVLAYWLALGVGTGITSLGKIFFHRDRPDVALRAIDVTSFSFPSGHATTATVLFGFLVYLLFRAYPSWWVRVPAMLCGTLLAVLVDLSRMYLGVHYLSDVIAGNLVGVASLLFAIVVIELIAHRSQFPILRVFRLPHVAVALLITIVFALVFRTIIPVSAINKITVPIQSITLSDIPNIFVQGKLSTSTETLVGTKQDPINIILVASSTCLITNIESAHWTQVTWTTSSLFFKTFPEFYQGIPNDFVFEKEATTGTNTIMYRAHIWNTNYVSKEGSIYVGSISRTQGSKDFTQARDAFMKNLLPLTTSRTVGAIDLMVLSGCKKQ